MSILDDIKGAWKQNYTDEQDPEMRLMTAVVGTFMALVGLGLIFLVLAIVWAIAKALFPFILGGVIIYAIGAWKFDWSVPSFLKKFIK